MTGYSEMTVRLNKRQAEQTRSAIQATQLINRLQDHALNGTEMSTTQIKAAEIILKKSLPDLKATELSGQLELPSNIRVDFDGGGGE